jgi:molybdate transport system substrate-binding protein
MSIKCRTPNFTPCRNPSRIRRRAFVLAACASPTLAQPEVLTVAAASDMRYALDEICQSFSGTVQTVYGASGKLATQIRHGAPFDIFLAADRAFTDALHAEGHSPQPSQLYARGHLVAWSLNPALGRLPLPALIQHESVRRFAIANPTHAPYGQRAEQALRHQGLWAMAQSKLVVGDNVAQAAQFVATQAAQAGLLALSLVLAPQLAGKGAFTRIPSAWHSPLDQALIVTRRGANHPLAQSFVQHLLAQKALLRRYGLGVDD